MVFFLATPHSMGDFSSPTRDCTHTPCGGSGVLTTGPPAKSRAFSYVYLTAVSTLPEVTSQKAADESVWGHHDRQARTTRGRIQSLSRSGA